MVHAALVKSMSADTLVRILILEKQIHAEEFAEILIMVSVVLVK